MFGHNYYGTRFYGERYFGPAVAGGGGGDVGGVGTVSSQQTQWTEPVGVSIVGVTPVSVDYFKITHP
jgi:hypothetical protein